MLKRLICWWFGCEPEYEHPCELAPNYVVPCKRCREKDTSYADRCDDTRHERLKYWVWRNLWDRWLPEKCEDCGRRFGRHDKCEPFPF